MNAEAVKKLITERSGAPPVVHSESELARIGDALLDTQLKTYLTGCLPREVLGASGVRLLPLSAILDELDNAPSWYLHEYDYITIATSIGGNAIVVHAWGDRRAKVYWADHTSFSDGLISYKDRATGDWVDLHDYTPENVERALVPLGSDLFEFLAALLREELTSQLDALD